MLTRAGLSALQTREQRQLPSQRTFAAAPKIQVPLIYFILLHYN